VTLHQHIPSDATCIECQRLAHEGLDLARFAYVEHLSGYTALGPKLQEGVRKLATLLSCRPAKFIR
jgi:hypothetical protein